VSRTTRISLVFLALFITLVIYMSFHSTKVECEVCVTFQGQTNCGKASSETREGAVRSAVTAACATIAGGMTETIRCDNTPPDRTTCTP
jgi:hypothetical protein